MPATSTSRTPAKPGVDQGNQGAHITPACKKPNNDGHQSWVAGQSGSRAYRQNTNARAVRAMPSPSAVKGKFTLTLKLPLIALIPMIDAQFHLVSCNQGKMDSPDTYDGALR